MNDVVVVGAGPVGLLLASELALGGARVQLLERLPAPSRTIKAGSINLASAELLGRRGMLEELREASTRTVNAMAAQSGLPAAQLAATSRRAGHFAGIWLPAELVDEDDPLLRGHREALGATMLPQAEVEAILARRAAACGVEVRRGVKVTGVDIGPDDVTLSTNAGPLTARWVVGCDGGRSPVRHAAGFEFDGTDPEITGRQAVLDLDGAEDLIKGWNWSTRGVYCYGPQPGRVLTVEFDGPPADRSTAVTADELQESLRRVSGTDVVVRGVVGDATRWTDNARQADTYRRGRVLLAGDAAHVHSPFSGQGLNLGLADAMNLGWKLAAVVAGRAEESLLDTYTDERRPAGAWVLDWTRAQVALMRPEPKNGPLRVAVTDLMNTRDGATLTAAKIAGLARRLPGEHSHELVGFTVPDVELAHGRLLREWFVDGEYVLLAPRALLSEVAADRITCVAAPDGTVPMLVRPDGIVALAGAQLASAADVRAALLTR